ncbi:glycosyltransferase family 4 protein [Novosphingobium sp.]|uniref:glycosyltransferase family 4 protein n=1 Tax=Novosphingobium sp. TaxID=1874826 RepID=UPI00260D4A59|nr:glycosyltransferase family 4 protein [Novosphingobium sp.]
MVDLVANDFDHRVISLNRSMPDWTAVTGMATGRHSPILERRTGFRLESLRYAGFPKGILHATTLRKLADGLCNLTDDCRRPDLLIGYKLSIEGLVVAEMARRLGLPYALVVQGNTDAKIVAARPDLRRLFAWVLQGAEVVFSLAPWAIARIEALLRVRARTIIHLPCPIALDQPIAPRVTGASLITAFHLRHHRLKNFTGLARAVSLARRIDSTLELEVVGGGDARDTAVVRTIAQRSRGIRLAGAVSNRDMAARYNDAAGFVLPSRRESFGMVFLEALFCGAPVVYPADRAISGWFEDEPFAIPVDPEDPRAIAAAMLHIKRDEPRLKRALSNWQTSSAADKFKRASIARAFEGGLRAAAMASSAAPVPAYGDAA